MSPEIIIALITSFTTIFVAFLQLKKSSSRRQNTNINSKRNWKLIAFFIVLNIMTLTTAILWIHAGTVDIGNGSRDYENFISEAKSQDKPYILESVVALVRIVDSTASRRAEVRITYVIRPLKNISEKDGTFVEEFRLNPDKIPFHWFGTNVEEKGNDISNTYSVNISGNKGEVITVMTGATYTYPLPMPDSRVTTDGVTRLDRNEDYYMYLNTSDYIANLVVVIESPTTTLSQVERGAFEQEANQPLERKESYLGIRAKSRRDQVSISAKWNNLKPGTSGGIIYSWD